MNSLDSNFLRIYTPQRSNGQCKICATCATYGTSGRDTYRYKDVI